ncbi:MAG: hypothetical protein IJY25_06260 [Bacilli bacterium]|nr:hypothetical protein [Bacilli bacterium]
MKKAFFERLIVNIIIISILTFVLIKITNLICLCILFIPIIYFIFATIISTIEKIKYIMKFDNKSIKDIELKLQNSIFDSIDYTITENFIFVKNNLKIINYSDIFLIKKDSTFSVGKSIYVYPCVYIVSKEGNYCLINFNSNSSFKIFDIYDFIIKKNHDVLIDDTRKNKITLHKMKGIELKKNWKIKAKRNIKLFRFSKLY